MTNPLYNKKHRSEYGLCGIVATALYTVFLLLFLEDHQYQHLYYLFIGNFLFVAVIGYYTYSLINRPFEGKSSVSMLVAGHLALVTGIIISILTVLVCGFIYFPGVFTTMSPEKLLPGAPSSIEVARPAGLIFMLEANVILVSGGAASFLIVIFSYAAKRNQTKDKPTTLENYVIKK